MQPVIIGNATLYLGSRGNSSMKYIGELDDVRISDAALSAGVSVLSGARFSMVSARHR